MLPAYVTLALFFIAVVPRPAVGQDEENIAVAELVDEAVDALVTHAYKVGTKPEIYQKAWLGLLLELGRIEESTSKNFSKLSDKDAEQSFLAALQELSKTPGQRRTYRELAESALQIYCRQHDAYTRYTRSEDYQHILLMSKAGGSSVGMSINERDGSYYCYPMPGSPATNGGVKPGDRLISVDGRSVEGRPLEFIASLIKGAPGTAVSLRVEHSFGRSETLKVVRETLAMPPLLTEKKITGYVLRVRKFSADLVEETRIALKNMSSSSTLTIDLRGCAGGELDEAIEFASLFLNKDEPVVTVRMRGREDEQNTAKNAPEFDPAAIILLQDEGTASAAEMVIAALIYSKETRATSQGAKSYGKGVMQSRIELKGGGALTLTTGQLIAPQGRTWDGVGLLPSLENAGQIFPESSPSPAP